MASSSVFNAYEKDGVPGGHLHRDRRDPGESGVLALLAGLGYVGLAGVSILSNLVSAVILAG